MINHSKFRPPVEPYQLWLYKRLDCGFRNRSSPASWPPMEKSILYSNGICRIVPSLMDLKFSSANTKASHAYLVYLIVPSSMDFKFSSANTKASHAYLDFSYSPPRKKVRNQLTPPFTLNCVDGGIYTSYYCNQLPKYLNSECI